MAGVASGLWPLDTGFRFFEFSLHHHCLLPAQGWGPGGSVQGPGWNQRKVSETGKRIEKAQLVLEANFSLPHLILPTPTPAPTFLGGGVPGTVLGSASSSSSSEGGTRSWEGWETGGREVEGCAREPSLPTVVSMAIM